MTVKQLESEAHRYAHLAQFTFSPKAARHYRTVSEKFQAQADEQRLAEMDAAGARQAAKVGAL